MSTARTASVTLVATTPGRGPRRLTIALSGEIDVAVRERLYQVVDDHRLLAGDVEVTVDVTRVTFMDSTGLSFLARLGVLRPGRVTLRGSSPVLTEMLRITGINELVTITPGPTVP